MVLEHLRNPVREEAVMKITRFAVGSFLFVALLASASMAQQRTFVSGLGNDMNPCTRIAPCRTIAQALMGTSAGGEVIVLDSAGYGPAAVSQAVSIIAPPGVYAGISVFSGDGIDVNAGASDTIILRGLTLNNQGSTGSGMVFNTGATLHVENCVVSGFTTSQSAGLFFKGPGNLEVKDSIFRGNANGVIVQPTSGTALAAIEQVRFETHSLTGLTAADRSKVTVRNSTASGNGGSGFLAVSVSSAAAELNVESCIASNNASNGIIAQSQSTGAATVRVSNSTVTDNAVGGLANSGSPAVLLSRGNNTVEGNGMDTVGTIGSYTAK
jgi:hypothetical protein